MGYKWQGGIMIIGEGDVASAIIDKESLLFFASGVSNSQETRESEYQREKDLLLIQDRKQHSVYFGSLCIFYADTRYARHKREMEELVKENFGRYTIVRLGNITWGNNPHTLINYFKARKQAGEPIEVRDEYRYVVDREEFRHWLGLIPDFNCEMNIPGRRMKVREIVEELV